jgi:hypothetical protein
MNLETFKSAINDKLPSSREKLFDVYNKTGKLLWKEEWDRLKNLIIDDFHESKIAMSNEFIGIICTMKTCFKNKADISELINYIFNLTVQKLNNK